MISQQQYRENEQTKYLMDRKQCNSDSEKLAWFNDALLKLAWFDESLGHLTTGNYGEHAQYQAQQIIENKRCNRRAQLFNLICHYEYRLSGYYMGKLWKVCIVKDKINSIIDGVL